MKKKISKIVQYICGKFVKDKNEINKYEWIVKFLGNSSSLFSLFVTSGRRWQLATGYGCVEWIVTCLNWFSISFHFRHVATQHLFPMSSLLTPRSQLYKLKSFPILEKVLRDIAASEWTALIFAHKRYEFHALRFMVTVMMDAPLQRGQSPQHSMRKHMCLLCWLHGKVYALNKLCSRLIYSRQLRHFDVSKRTPTT